jgi:hypothetical protein
LAELKNNWRKRSVQLGLLVAIALLVWALIIAWPPSPIKLAEAARQGSIIALPNRGRPFILAMPIEDTIGAIDTCMDRVHVRGGGFCQIKEKSIRPGLHNTLQRKYPDVMVSVR